MRLLLIESSDFDTEIPPDAGVVFWDRYCEPGRGVSLPALVEEDADRLRRKYLRWIRCLGDFQIQGKSVTEHLMLREGFSFWWMTLLAEKSNGFSPRIYDAVRVLALESVLTAGGVSELVFFGNDRALSETVRELCEAMNIRFARQTGGWWASVRGRRTHPIWGAWIRGLLGLLKRIWMGVRSHVDRERLKILEGEVLFVQYFFDVDRQSASSGVYKTPYWTLLHEKIRAWRMPVRWTHLFTRSSAARTCSHASGVIRTLNRENPTTECHLLVNGLVTPRTLASALRDWARLWRVGIGLTGVRDGFRVPESRVSFWHLLSGDWWRSLFGSEAVANCLFLSQFEDLCGAIPRQQLGFVFTEHQAWERAFAYAWKENGHGLLVGVQHSTVRFWDLRHFQDPSLYLRKDPLALPLPDLIALNGPAAVRAYRRGEFPSERILELEALRFLDLEDGSVRSGSGEGKVRPGPRRVLVYCDYSPMVTHRLLGLIHQAAFLLDEETEFVVKPHPAAPFSTVDLDGVMISVAEDLGPLDRFDLAVCSNTTSANLDAYFSGLPVVSILEGGRFNLNPLRGEDAVRFASTASELAAEIRRGFSGAESVSLGEFFFVDRALPRWKSLLEPFTVGMVPQTGSDSSGHRMSPGNPSPPSN